MSPSFTKRYCACVTNESACFLTKKLEWSYVSRHKKVPCSRYTIPCLVLVIHSSPYFHDPAFCHSLQSLIQQTSLEPCSTTFIYSKMHSPTPSSLLALGVVALSACQVANAATQPAWAQCTHNLTLLTCQANSPLRRWYRLDRRYRLRGRTLLHRSEPILLPVPCIHRQQQRQSNYHRFGRTRQNKLELVHPCFRRDIRVHSSSRSLVNVPSSAQQILIRLT